MKSTTNSYRFPILFLIVGVAMAGVLPAVRVFSKEERHVPQRVAPVAPGAESNVAVQLVMEPDSTPEPFALIAPGSSVPDVQTPPAPTAQPGEIEVVHVGRVISGTSVPSRGGDSAASRAAGTFGLGEVCSCDEDCADSGDQCNIVQCIVRSFCTDNNAVPCATDQDCAIVDAGTCTDEVANCDENDPPDCNFVQRCAMVQLIGWPCEGDADFCTLDRCEDDGSGTGHSDCAVQDDGTGGTLSACAKQCVGGPAVGLRCNSASDCPQGSCQITLGGGCDSAAEACFVGPSLLAAIGRCCDTDVCTETDEASCAGKWYRYRDPEEQEGDGNCLCPKYGSGVAPPGDDLGSIGLVRPSGLTCDVGSRQTGGAVYCEDVDGDGLSPQFCQKRCVGGDNEGAPCTVDVPDCARLGTCSVGGTICQVANGGSDCGLCYISGDGCDADGLSPCPDGDFCEFELGLTCDPSNIGTCQEDSCNWNDIEGGCEDGFLNIGDDYAVANGSFVRLTQFRFRGGITNLGEDFVIEFWDESGARLVDAFAVNDLDRTGTHDWTVEVDCWPSCNPGQLEVPEQRPIIIPPNGYVVMRSARTVGTISGAAAFWSQTENPADIGLNDDTKAWVNNNPYGQLGTNVFIFELVGYKVPDPLGACCDDAETCEDTVRWDCGICSLTEPQVACASTLHDCPDALGLNSICQFNRWFGPISHDDFWGAGADLTLCNGLAPCDTGACCQGGVDGSCTVEREVDCVSNGGLWLGTATDCDPDCCPKEPFGVDCICETWNCVETATGRIPGFGCDPGNGNDDCDPGQTCEYGCAPDPAHITHLRHPYECHDDFGSPLWPPIPCDPFNGYEDCSPIPCTGDWDCPYDMFCDSGFCDSSLAMTCKQSFWTSVTVTKTDTIDSFFGVPDGDGCSLNPSADGVGWYERFTLEDFTPGDASDDCFVLTVDMCCSDPVHSPAWPFISSFLNCPCRDAADVAAIPPDFDISGDQLDGFGADSKANLAGRCEDGNYSATFTLPPDEYAYQINADKSCAGSATPCATDDDCPGSSCVSANPDYTVHFTVESCQIAACCIGETCTLTNKLDCLAQQGNFLGEGDQPIVWCQGNPCQLGSCCVDGTCLDDQLHETESGCESEDGVFFGGLTCFDDPCPACPFNSPANCQQVQSVFGPVPLMDRNRENGSADGSVGVVLADDLKFGGSYVDQICWNAGFFEAPCCATGCAQNIDSTWEVRIYVANPDCNVIPGALIDISTITVLNKIEGTGQGTGTWLYSGSLVSPIVLTGTPGLAGDTYWMEISGFGEPGCEVRATWSRDQGNDHLAISMWQAPEPADHPYTAAQVGSVDVGLCEDSGLGTPPVVLGACCTCSAEGPGVCSENFTQKDCVQYLRGVWVPCADCSDPDITCRETPANDNCDTPYLISNIPGDGSALIIVDQNNICATDDGPPLDGSSNGGCGGSITGNGELHDDIWYAYVAEHCGTLRITSCDSDGATADNDQMIAIYDGDALCPLGTGDELACNDDGCRGSGSAGPSTVELDVLEGQNLLIRIGGWNDEVPGGNIGDPRGFMEIHWSINQNCPSVVSPLPAPPPHDILKNRYISVAPQNEGIDHHLRLTLTSTLVNDVPAGGVYWADQPNADCISLVTSTKPASPPYWWNCPTAHLTGCPIIPTSTYDIHAVSWDDEVSVAALVANTQALPTNKWWGDVVGYFDPIADRWDPPNGNVTIDDAVAAMKTFVDPTRIGPGCGIPPCNATHVSVTDMEPGNTNQVVNYNDVFRILQAYRGEMYPYGSADLDYCPNDSIPGGGPEIRFLPIRTAPLGSPAGTVGAPITPVFNGTCWEYTIDAGGVEVDIDIQGGGWGNAVGSPALGAIQATVDSSGYDNGVGSELNPKGWPGNPLEGAYQAKNYCGAGGDLSPCVPPFDITCNGFTNGFCVPNENWIFRPSMSANDLPAIAVPALNYGFATAALDVTNTSDPDPNSYGTFGGLIVNVPWSAGGTYVIGPDLDPNNSFVTAGDGSPIAGVVFTPACITVIIGKCCSNMGHGTTTCEDDLTEVECAMRPSPWIFTPGAECYGPEGQPPASGFDCLYCEQDADCDGDGILDVVEIENCPPGDLSCRDCNLNCIPDECDIDPSDPDGSGQVSADCNGNGIPDECDLGGNDCNSNGIPDECELAGNDCDGNGVPDECDVAASDCNGNGIPDACDLAGNDCNGNFVPDECDVAVEDCNSNDVPDDCDIDPSDPDGNGQISPDSNTNGVPDECDPGACCFILELNGNFSCVDDTEENCAILTQGLGFFQGIDTKCPTEGVGTNIHLGVVVTHVVDPAQLCGPPDGGRAACIPGDPIDPWQTALNAEICHQFGVGPVSPPIPADFFGPGSDPFTGQVCLEGVPLGPTEWGEFGEADTLVKRTGGPVGTGDPFERCELPSANDVTVIAEVVALSLQSIAPITVTFNGGQNPEEWDVVVGLSAVTPTPGTITAFKTHCNGGTYNSELHVLPKFTFTKVDAPTNSAVLDTGLADIPFVTLIQDTDPQWTSEVSETLGLPSTICTDFHPGIEDTAPTMACDCNNNQDHDLCEIESPSPALPPHDILKNRYISIDPRGACGINVGKDLDIRLTLKSTLVNGVTVVGSQWWASSPDVNCIAVVGPDRPPSPPNWDACPTLHLTGCPIIPTSTYDIVVVDGAFVSESPLERNTQAKPGAKWHGDCVGFFDGAVWTPPNGTTSIDDAVAAIKTFQKPGATAGCQTPPCNATHVSVTDVVPNLNGMQINLKVNINDVFSIILGFQGNEYPGTDLMLCP